MVVETIVSAIVGLLGTSLTTYSNYKMEQLKADNQIRMMEAESRAMLAEADANIRITETQAQMAVEQSEAEAFAASQTQQKDNLPSDWLGVLMSQQGAARWFTYPVAVILLLLMGLGDAVNHLMRPVLTIYSLAIASWVTWQCWDLLPEADNLVASWQNWQDSMQVVLMLAVTMTTWWFGDRRVARHLSHLKEKKG